VGHGQNRHRDRWAHATLGAEPGSTRRRQCGHAACGGRAVARREALWSKDSGRAAGPMLGPQKSKGRVDRGKNWSRKFEE
jgi:hypothetical protein